MGKLWWAKVRIHLRSRPGCFTVLCHENNPHWRREKLMKRPATEASGKTLECHICNYNPKLYFSVCAVYQ